MQIGGYKQRKYMFAEDYPTQIELSLQGKFLYLDNVLAKYRIHAGQMTNLHQHKMILSDRVFVKSFVKERMDTISKLEGFSYRKIAKSMELRDAYDYYKLGKNYAVNYKYFCKATALLMSIPMRVKTIRLKFRLFLIIVYACFYHLQKGS